MTVEELIEELSRMDKNAEVCFAYSYGDYWGTTCADDVTYLEYATVTHSDYHNTNKVVDSDKEDDYEPEELKRVVLLS